MLDICQTCDGAGELSWEIYDAPSRSRDFGTVGLTSVTCPTRKGAGMLDEDELDPINKYIDTDYDPDE